MKNLLFYLVTVVTLISMFSCTKSESDDNQIVTNTDSITHYDTTSSKWGDITVIHDNKPNDGVVVKYNFNGFSDDEIKEIGAAYFKTTYPNFPTHTNADTSKFVYCMRSANKNMNDALIVVKKYSKWSKERKYDKSLLNVMNYFNVYKNDTMYSKFDRIKTTYTLKKGYAIRSFDDFYDVYYYNLTQKTIDSSFHNVHLEYNVSGFYNTLGQMFQWCIVKEGTTQIVDLINKTIVSTPIYNNYSKKFGFNSTKWRVFYCYAKSDGDDLVY